MIFWSLSYVSLITLCSSHTALIPRAKLHLLSYQRISAAFAFQKSGAPFLPNLKIILHCFLHHSHITEKPFLHPKTCSEKNCSKHRNMQNSHFPTICLALELSTVYSVHFQCSKMATTAKPVGCTYSLPGTGQIHGDSLSKVYAGQYIKNLLVCFHQKILKNIQNQKQAHEEKTTVPVTYKFDLTWSKYMQSQNRTLVNLHSSTEIARSNSTTTSELLQVIQPRIFCHDPCHQFQSNKEFSVTTTALIILWVHAQISYRCTASMKNQAIHLLHDNVLRGTTLRGRQNLQMSRSGTRHVH